MFDLISDVLKIQVLAAKIAGRILLTLVAVLTLLALIALTFPIIIATYTAVLTSVVWLLIRPNSKQETTSDDNLDRRLAELTYPRAILVMAPLATICDGPMIAPIAVLCDGPAITAQPAIKILSPLAPMQTSLAPTVKILKPLSFPTISVEMPTNDRQCKGTTKTGSQCKCQAVVNGYCSKHKGQARKTAVA